MMAEADNHNDDVRVRWSVSLIRFLLLVGGGVGAANL